MTNLEKYDSAFIEILGVKDDALPNLTYHAVSNWDSVGHMGLIACLEEKYEIMLETEDIISFSSYAKGKEILKKYGIEI